MNRSQFYAITLCLVLVLTGLTYIIIDEHNSTKINVINNDTSLLVERLSDITANIVYKHCNTMDEITVQARYVDNRDEIEAELQWQIQQAIDELEDLHYYNHIDNNYHETY